MGCQVVRVLTACIMFWRSAYLKSRYWSHPPVLHLNIRHPVKAGAHLKQKGQRLEKADLKVKSRNSPSKKSEQEKWVCWFWSDIKIPRNDTSLLPEECQGWHWRGPRGYILYFSGQFIGQMSRDMIILIISGEPQPLFLTATFLTKFPHRCPAEPFIWWESVLAVRSDDDQSCPQWHSVSQTLPRPAESALLQSLQYSPYFACCALFS